MKRSNIFIEKEDHYEIIFKNGEVGFIDKDDFDKVSCKWWHIDRSGRMSHNFYKGNGKYKTILMHTIILTVDNGFITDHVNRNQLDNRKINLRQCTRQQNQRNRSSAKGSASQYLGVSLATKKDVWCANIVINKKKIYLGRFKDEKDAALAYDAAARYYFGEFANPNFPALPQEKSEISEIYSPRNF